MPVCVTANWICTCHVRTLSGASYFSSSYMNTSSLLVSSNSVTDSASLPPRLCLRLPSACDRKLSISRRARRVPSQRTQAMHPLHPRAQKHGRGTLRGCSHLPDVIDVLVFEKKVAWQVIQLLEMLSDLQV